MAGGERAAEPIALDNKSVFEIGHRERSGEGMASLDSSTRCEKEEDSFCSYRQAVRAQLSPLIPTHSDAWPNGKILDRAAAVAAVLLVVVSHFVSCSVGSGELANSCMPASHSSESCE